MNQSIQVLDGFSYSEEHQAMQFNALQGGHLIHCFISDIEKSASDEFYKANQFDIEEALTDAIEDECWNDKGEVWISALDIRW